MLRFWRRWGGGWWCCDCFRRFGSFSPLLLFSLFFSVCFFSFVFGLVLPLFPFLFSVFSFPSFPSLSFVLPLPLSLLCFFVFSPRLSSVFLFFLFSPFSPPLLSAFLGSIYRGQGRCFLQLSRGAAGWSAIGRGCRGSVGGVRWVVGHCVRSVGSRRESGRQNSKKKKLPFFLLPRCVIGGKKMNSVVQNDTVLLFPFIFFFFLNA